MLKFETLTPSQKYIVLALASDILLKETSVIFHYYGPSELKKHAKSVAKIGLNGIIDQLYSLETVVLKEYEDTFPVFRRTYLVSQIISLRSLLESPDTKLSGEKLVSAVNTILGFAPRGPYNLEEIQQESINTLKKYGYNSYEEIKSESLKNSKKPLNKKEQRILINYLEDCTKKDIAPNLYFGDQLNRFLEKAHIRLLREKEGYPTCYYIYQGNGKAAVFLSGDHNKTKLSAIRTMIHELCPGHHIYYVYREMLYSLGCLGEEATLDLLYGSETPYSEGVAETVLVYLRSLDPTLLNQVMASTAHEHYCKKVLYNVWYKMFVEGSMNKEEASKYLLETAGFKGEKIETWLSFLDGWRVYYPSYPMGTERLKSYLANCGEEGFKYLYIPKSLPVLDRFEETISKQNQRRAYEKDSRKAEVRNDFLAEGSPTN